MKEKIVMVICDKKLLWLHRMILEKLRKIM